MSVATEAPVVAARPRRQPVNPTGLDYAYALVLTLSIGLLLVGLTPALWHWFVVPCAVCGVLIGADAVRWARGRVELFDPVGLVGVIGFHFFFTAPLLHVRWEQWPLYLTGPPDWRPWLGKMALLNVVGLVAYRITLALWAAKSRHTPRRTSHWRLVPERLGPAMLCALAASAAAEAFALVAAGGWRGFESAVIGQSSLAGLGWMLALGESFPMVCFVAWLVHARLRQRRISAPWLVAGLAALVLAQFAIGGLRGSRGNLIWPVLIAFGIVHLTVRPIAKRTLVVATVVGLAFMYFYGFYKFGGVEALTQAFDREARGRLEAESGRTIPALLLQDLGRADIQALVLYRYQLPDIHYTKAWGGTYLAGAAVMVPQAILPHRSPGKLRNGTDLLYGAGTFDRSVFYSQNIYGLGGEALLNFGVLAIPLSYIPLALIVGRAQRFTQRLAPDDSRRYLVPLVGVLCILCLTSDLGNVVFGALQFGLLITLVIAFGSRRVRPQLR